MKPLLDYWIPRVLLETLVIGVPLALILWWFFDLRRDIRPVGGRDLNEIREEERLRTTSLVKYSLTIAAILCVTFILGELRVLAGYKAAENARRIAIMPFDNRTGDSDLDGLGEAAAERVALRLRPLRELEVLPEKAASTAGILVAGSYYFHADSIRFGIHLMDAANGQLLRYFVPAAVPRKAAIYFMPKLSREVSDTIARHFQSPL